MPPARAKPAGMNSLRCKGLSVFRSAPAAMICFQLTNRLVMPPRRLSEAWEEFRDEPELWVATLSGGGNYVFARDWIH